MEQQDPQAEESIETVVLPRDPNSPEAVYLASSQSIPQEAVDDMEAVVREQQALLDGVVCQRPACVLSRNEPCMKPVCLQARRDLERLDRTAENYRRGHESLGEENQRLRSYTNMLHELHEVQRSATDRLYTNIRELERELQRLRDELRREVAFSG